MSETYDSSDIEVIDLTTMSLSQVIAELEKRPLMWLPEKHIMYLETFLNGYLFGKSKSTENELLTKFNRYIEKKYEIKTTHGWARNIYHMSSDPHAALDMFFEEIREFSSSNRN